MNSSNQYLYEVMNMIIFSIINEFINHSINIKLNLIRVDF
jgi:hypothetical protein